MPENKEIQDSAADKAGKSGRRAPNLIPQLLCVVLAVFVWLYVMANNSPDYERTFSGVPVSIENTALLSNSNGLTVLSGAGNLADITITGKKSDLISYSLEDIVASVDVGRITEAGRHQLSVSVTTPSGAILKSVSPTSVEIYVDQIATKVVPVKVNIVSIQYDQSISLGVPTPDVNTVTISGPASVIDAAESAAVNLELGTVTTSVSARGQLHLLTANGAAIDNPFVMLSQSSVGVSIPVYIEREIPITVGTKHGYFNDDNATIRVVPASIMVRADPKLLEGVESLEIATIDEKQITSSETQIVTITLPEGVENVSGSTTATISVTHKGTMLKSVAVQNISIKNPNNLTYKLLTDSVNITLRAPNSIAEEISAEDIRLEAELNYSGVTGVVQLPVTVIVSKAFPENTVYELGEYKISVMIQK